MVTRTTSFPRNLKAQWVRVHSDQDCKASVSFHFSDDIYRNPSEGEELFKAIAKVEDTAVNSALLYPAKRNRHLRVLNGEQSYDFTQFDFDFQPTKPDASLRKKLTVHPEFSVDEASVILESKEARSIVGKQGRGIRLRLPKGPKSYDKPFTFGHPRMHREVESERMMANIHGTFYEVPFWIVGDAPLYTKMRPVCTHKRQISDFTTWNGLLVLAGLKADAKESTHVYKSDDGNTSLWFGGIDDLWKFGKPTGVGGPWKDTAVKAGVPSDPYLMTGYDKKPSSSVLTRIAPSPWKSILIIGPDSMPTRVSNSRREKHSLTSSPPALPPTGCESNQTLMPKPPPGWFMNKEMLVPIR